MRIFLIQEFPVDLSEMHSLIEIALERYDADKIGIPDYALESAGKNAMHTIIIYMSMVE